MIGPNHISIVFIVLSRSPSDCQTYDKIIGRNARVSRKLRKISFYLMRLLIVLFCSETIKSFVMSLTSSMASLYSDQAFLPFKGPGGGGV